MKNIFFNNKIRLFTLIFINFNLLIIPSNSNAFIPDVYMPKTKDLINSSIGIGLTANQYIKHGQLEEAIGLAKLALSLNPKEIELWIILARAQLNNNLPNEALVSIKQARNINPNVASVWFTQASIEMQISDITAAVKSINKTLSLEKTNANAYFLLGNARLIQQKHLSALEAFKKATNFNSKFWQAINNQGLVYYEIGEQKKAISAWRKALKIKSDPEPKLALAIALYKAKPDNSESIKLAKEALEENPNYFFEEHQKEQLWGKKLQEAGKELFKNPKLKSIINTAYENSTFKNKKK